QGKPDQMSPTRASAPVEHGEVLRRGTTPPGRTWVADRGYLLRFVRDGQRIFASRTRARSGVSLPLRAVVSDYPTRNYRPDLQVGRSRRGGRRGAASADSHSSGPAEHA